MHEVASRRRTQAPPPHVVVEALVEPDRDPLRPWLHLAADEQRPEVLEEDGPHRVVWSSSWPARPDARVRFDLDVADGGTGLRWTLLVEDPVPGADQTRRLRRRMDELINRDLRPSFDL